MLSVFRSHPLYPVLSVSLPSALKPPNYLIERPSQPSKKLIRWTWLFPGSCYKSLASKFSLWLRLEYAACGELYPQIWVYCVIHQICEGSREKELPTSSSFIFRKRLCSFVIALSSLQHLICKPAMSYLIGHQKCFEYIKQVPCYSHLISSSISTY